MIRYFGHSDAAGKAVPPCVAMDFLGLRLSVESATLELTTAKIGEYSSLIEAVVTGTFAKLESFNSLVHKLLHAACVVVLGRQHLFHCLRALRAEVRSRTGPMVPVTANVKRELQ